jgi:hypothetical protein
VVQTYSTPHTAVDNYQSRGFSEMLTH